MGRVPLRAEPFVLMLVTLLQMPLLTHAHLLSFLSSAASQEVESPCTQNEGQNTQCVKSIYDCTGNVGIRKKCRLTCGTCARLQLPPPPSKAAMDTFHADAHHFLARCFMKQDAWGDYTKVHRRRFMETFAIAAPYLANTSGRVLHLGDGQGYMPMLFHKYLGLTHQVAVDGAPSKVRYHDHPAKQTCTLQQHFRPPGSRRFQLTADERAPSEGHGYAIAADELDLDMAQPWPTIAPGTFDAAISLEVLEHVTHGPMHFLLNAARALRRGGYLIVTTPNGIGWATINRALLGRNPLSYDYFRCEAVGPAASRPNKERDLNCTIHIGHTKEYTPSELHDAFVNAGFAVVEQLTFSPYGFKNRKVESVLPAKLLESEAARRGEVHFIVGKKLGCHATARPCHKGFINYPRSTLYDYNEVLLEGDPLWS